MSKAAADQTQKPVLRLSSFQKIGFPAIFGHRYPVCPKGNLKSLKPVIDR